MTPADLRGTGRSFRVWAVGVIVAGVVTALAQAKLHSDLSAARAAERDGTAIVTSIRKVDGLEWRAIAGEDIGPITATFGRVDAELRTAGFDITQTELAGAIDS